MTRTEIIRTIVTAILNRLAAERYTGKVRLDMVDGKVCNVLESRQAKELLAIKHAKLK